MRQYSRLYDGTILDGCFYSLTAQEFATGKPVPRDNSALARAMCRYEGDCVQRVNHFLKVHGFAKIIGEGEGYPPETRQLLEAAALVHDIGIRPSLEKYGSSAGPYQEKEGPAVAKAMLEELGYPPAFVERVCFLVGHHHTYTAIDGVDYQALVEADFLVNISEDGMERPAIETVEKQIFRTAVGKELLRTCTLHKVANGRSAGEISPALLVGSILFLRCHTPVRRSFPAASNNPRKRRAFERGCAAGRRGEGLPSSGFPPSQRRCHVPW